MLSLYANKQNQYWEDKIASSHGNTAKLLRNLSAVLRLKKASPTAADGLSVDSFSAAFTAKTDSVRSSTVSAPGPVFDDLAKECRLDAFEPIDDTTVQRLISHAANKNCELDPAPTWLLKMFASELSPFITALFNASFHDGVFPSSQKRAVVTTALK